MCAAVFLNNNLIHIRTATLAHTWELQSTNAVCCRRASEEQLEEEEASLSPTSRVQSPLTARGGFDLAAHHTCRLQVWEKQLVMKDAGDTAPCADRQQVDGRQNHKFLCSFLCFA